MTSDERDGTSRPLITLASTSPRRRDLLARRGISFDVVDPKVDEDRFIAPDPLDLAVELACAKARAVAARQRRGFVIGADTVVAVDGRSLGKPADAEAARAMLRTLSGRTHLVATGYCVVRAADGVEIGSRAVTTVSMRVLADDEIERYVRTGEPLDKAGGYAIQGGAASFVTHVDTDVDNVIGLPVDLVLAALARLGCEVRPLGASR